jgi:hypothetical protein
MDTKDAGSFMRLTTFQEACHSRGKFRCGRRFTFFGPGRAGPAPTDFRAKPKPRRFWRLATSSVRTPESSPIIGNQHISPITANTLSFTTRRLLQHQSGDIPLEARPVTNGPESIREHARHLSTSFCTNVSHRTLLVISVVPTAALRHCRSQSPEIPGRIVFFTIETGRSPPLGGSPPSGAAPNVVAPRTHSTFHE